MPNSRTALILKPVQQLVSQLNSLYQKPPETIRGIDPGYSNSWFSPLQPVRPFAPKGAEPVGFQIWAGQNLIWQPRADSEYTAADLKALASYPLARICIENAKDAVCRAQWEIQLRPRPGETRADVQRRSKNEDTDKIKELSDFFQYPDREHNWQEWLRPLLDDMLVIDAPAVLVRKTFRGDIAELQVIRGEMITRYVDEQGFTPVPPSPAFVQNFWGMPYVDLTTDQLLYKPRNIAPRNTLASQLYGMSPVEQLADEIQIGIQRLRFVLAYYMEGSVPGVVHVVPRGTNPDRIEEAMRWMNSDLAGNLAKRNQWRMIQGFNEPGKPDQIIFSKEPLLAGIYDDKHIRQICYGIGVSSQRLMKMIRTEGKGTSDAAEIEGTLPYVLWVKGFIDYFIQRKLGFTQYEMSITPFIEPDPLKNAAALTMLVQKAVLTPNEARKRVGEELKPEPEADRLGVITGTGFVPIGIPSAQAGLQAKDDGKLEPHPVTPNPAAVASGNGAPKDHNAARGQTPASQEAGGGRSTGKNVGVSDGKESLQNVKKKVEKATHIDPAALSPDSHQALHQIEKSVRDIFDVQFDDAMSIVDGMNDADKTHESVMKVHGLQKSTESVPDPGKYNRTQENKIRKLITEQAAYAESGPLFDPTGKYLCGGCEYIGAPTKCRVVQNEISESTGGCRLWTIEGTKVAELERKIPQLDADYAERPRAKGFGCSRCEYASIAKKSWGVRTLWCAYWGLRVAPLACCSEEDGPDLVMAPGDKGS